MEPMINKGVDDALKNGIKPKVHSGLEAQEQVEAIFEQASGNKIGKSPRFHTSRLKWPSLNLSEIPGLAGEFLDLVRPHTEADDAALLFQFLTVFGSIIGSSAHFTAEADKHFANLFVVLVGRTSKGRKGSSLGHILRVFGELDQNWKKMNIATGLSSGEGLVYRVRDKILDEDQKPIDLGVDDKRLLVIESEFASLLKVMKREGNTLSPNLRNAWDGKDLQIMTKNSPIRSSEPHISIIGHITDSELLSTLNSTEASNGFGNRFLLACVKRSKCLPEGGQFHRLDITQFLNRLERAIEFGKNFGPIERDLESQSAWAAIYEELSEGRCGLLGSMTSRRETQVMRLATIFALLDLSAVIRIEHLAGAIEVERYGFESARFIFGEALGNPTADKIIDLLRNEPKGLTRTDIQKRLNNNVSGHPLTQAFDLLLEMKLAFSAKEPTEGRSAERWHAIAPTKETKEGSATSVP